MHSRSRMTGQGYLQQSTEQDIWTIRSSRAREITTTRKGGMPEPAGSKARPPGKSGSWTVPLGAQKLISFQILHMPFIELTDSARLFPRLQESSPPLVKEPCVMNTFSKHWVTAHLFLCAFATEFTWIITSVFYMVLRGWVNSQQFQEWNVQKDFQDHDTTGFGNSKSLLSKTCFLIWFTIFHVLCICYNLCSNNIVQRDETGNQTTARWGGCWIFWS